MKRLYYFSLLILCFCSCAKNNADNSARLNIWTRDTANKPIPGATVKLYTNSADPGITLTSDADGVALFTNLQPTVKYFWLAEKGCYKGEGSLWTVRDAIQYGISMLTEKGVLQFRTSSIDTFAIITATDLFGNTPFGYILTKNDPLTLYPKVGTQIVRTQKLNDPSTKRDTAIKFSCGTVTTLSLPY